MLQILILGGIAAFLVMVFGVPLWRARRLLGTTRDALEAALNRPLPDRGRTLVYFHTPHCGHCRRVGPLVDQLGQRGFEVIRIDPAVSPQPARRLGVGLVPTVLVIEDSTVARVLIGEAASHTLNGWLIEPPARADHRPGKP